MKACRWPVCSTKLPFAELRRTTFAGCWTAFPVAEPEHPAPPEAQVPPSELVEPLSERELESTPTPR